MTILMYEMISEMFHCVQCGTELAFVVGVMSPARHDSCCVFIVPGGSSVTDPVPGPVIDLCKLID